MKMLLLVVLSLWPVLVEAQTPTFRLQWQQAEAIAEVQQFVYTLVVDQATPLPVVSKCVAALPSGSTCTAPLPPLPSGPHTLVLSVFNGFGSAASDPLQGRPPVKPVSITVTVTITLP